MHRTGRLYSRRVGHPVERVQSAHIRLPSWVQVRRKVDEENLAEWLVEITVTPDADAGSRFAVAYDGCAL